jgi:tetratricopeptide (TPR) repeat protein
LSPAIATHPPFPRRDAILVLAIALALRIALLATTAHDPIFEVPMLDAEYLVNWAQSIAAGDLWGSPEHSAYFRTPLYPMFLAAIFQLPGNDLLLARIAQAVLGSIAAVLIASIAARRFGRVAGWSAGLLAALSWPLLHYGRELLISALLVFLVALLLWVWDRTTPQSSGKRWFGLGMLVGANALAWSSLITLAPFVMALAAWEDAPTTRRRIERAVLVAAGVLTLILPIAIRNRAVSGDWVPLASQGGINLWIGNNPEADGISARLPGFSSWRNEDVDAALAREYGHRVGPAEQDRYFRRKAFTFLREHPADAVGLFARKMYFFFQGYEIRNDRDLESLRERNAILKLPLPDFGWVAPLAIAGLFFARKRWREIAHLWGTALVVAATVAMFFVTARYRIAAWPALLPLAGAGAAGILERGAAPTTRGVRIALVVVLVLLARIDFLNIRHPDPSQPHFQYGNVYARVQRYTDAEQEYRTALSIAPEFGEAHHHLGALYLEQNRLPEAIDELREAVRLLPNSFRARRSLAEALEAQGSIEEAIRIRRENVELTMGDHEDMHALARVLGTAKQFPESWALFERILSEKEKEGSPITDPWLLLNAGQTALVMHHESQGLDLLKRASQYEPTRQEALEATALYYLSLQRTDEAMHILSDLILQDPTNSRLIRLRAAARYTSGDATGAVEDLEHLLQMDPNDQEAKTRLAEIRGRLGTLTPEKP